MHGAELRLIEAGLELVGGDHHLIVAGVEGLAHRIDVERLR